MCGNLSKYFTTHAYREITQIASLIRLLFWQNSNSQILEKNEDKIAHIYKLSISEYFKYLFFGGNNYNGSTNSAVYAEEINRQWEWNRL